MPKKELLSFICYEKRRTKETIMGKYSELKMIFLGFSKKLNSLKENKIITVVYNIVLVGIIIYDLRYPKKPPPYFEGEDFTYEEENED